MVEPENCASENESRAYLFGATEVIEPALRLAFPGTTTEFLRSHDPKTVRGTELDFVTYWASGLSHLRVEINEQYQGRFVDELYRFRLRVNPDGSVDFLESSETDEGKTQMHVVALDVALHRLSEFFRAHIYEWVPSEVVDD